MRRTGPGANLHCQAAFAPAEHDAHIACAQIDSPKLGCACKTRHRCGKKGRRKGKAGCGAVESHLSLFFFGIRACIGRSFTGEA
jgi:hypothetical protein